VIKNQAEQTHPEDVYSSLNSINFILGSSSMPLICCPDYALWLGIFVLRKLLFKFIFFAVVLL